MTPPRKPARWSLLGMLCPVVYVVGIVALAALVAWPERHIEVEVIPSGDVILGVPAPWFMTRVVGYRDRNALYREDSVAVLLPFLR